jgi:hypothetical protein
MFEQMKQNVSVLTVPPQSALGRYYLFRALYLAGERCVVRGNSLLA